MNIKDTRLLVVGAGTNGSICAARLQESGMNVTVLARGERYAQIKERGIIIENPLTSKRTVSMVPIIPSLEENDVYDYILVIIRKSQLGGILPALAKNKSPNIVFMGNNFQGPKEICAVIDEKRVLMGFVFGSGKLENGVVYGISSTNGILRRVFKKNTPFGEIDGSITPRLQRLIEVLRTGGLPVEISSNIKDFLSVHAALVVCISMPIIQEGGGGLSQAELVNFMNTNRYFEVGMEAFKEFIRLFRSVGRRVLPSSMNMILTLPTPWIKSGFKKILNSKVGEVITYDYMGSIDEVKFLSKEIAAYLDSVHAHASNLCSLVGASLSM